MFSTNFPIVPIAATSSDFDKIKFEIITTVPMAAIWYRLPILIKLNSKFRNNILIKLNLKFRTNKKKLYSSIGGYMFETDN